ncbi:Adipocyte plasma membrane-associated protein [Sarcoptes scabiei]|nr:Adipocyte plasma membrane-associated protein [Sarcoptes scabiei]
MNNQHAAIFKPDLFKQKCLKTLVAFLFFCGNWYFNVLLIVLINERVPLNVLPLPDILFDLLPHWYLAIYFSEMYQSLLLSVLILIFLFHRSGNRIAQRYFVVTGIVLFMHAIFVSATRLSVPGIRDACIERIDQNLSNLEFLIEILHRATIFMQSFGLRIFSRRQFCGDYINSFQAVQIIIG